MPADTNSPLLGLLLMGTGNDNNSWGVNNNSNLTQIENAIAGIAGITGLAGGSRTLTALEAQSAILILSGTLVADQTIVVPNLSKMWKINNICTGAFFTLIKTAAGNPINVPAGTTKDIICLSSNVVIRTDAEKVGELFYHAGANAPAGSLECNGATPLRASAVDLFLATGTIWGAGNGTTTFTIPDGTTAGKFLRSRTGAVTVGTAQANQNKSHTHTGSGTTSGVSAFHTHTVSGTTSGMSANDPHSHTTSNGVADSITQGAASAVTILRLSIGGGITILNTTSIAHTHTFSATTSTDSVDHTHTYSFTTSTGSADGTEARPEALVGVLCIRY